MTTVAVVTTSRADYSHLYWPLRKLIAHIDVNLKLIVMASHLSPEFGNTVGEIERAGFPIAAKVECLLSSDTDVGMAKSIGLGVLSLADVLADMRPDILLLIADRYEMLAPAVVALALRIPIAHIEGGERSEGAIDDAVRNAITKMSHIHFTSTFAARERVISLGEEAWRVHRAGAPSLDHLRESKIPSQEEIEDELRLDLSKPTIVIAYHPVTLLDDTNTESEELFAALHRMHDQLIFCYPNADAGSRALIKRTKEFLQERGDGRLFVNLPAVQYWALLKCAQVFVGNSSSGIMETASFGLPTVNVGIRQAGRGRPRNVIDTSADSEHIYSAILTACSADFRSSLRGMENPYGDGHASEKIVSVLTTLPNRTTLLMKRADQE